MQLTVEISMYPLHQDYKTFIRDFIDRLNQQQELKVNTSATSTLVLGEFRYVMRVLTELMEWSYSTHGRSVFVTKFIPAYEPDID